MAIDVEVASTVDGLPVMTAGIAYGEIADDPGFQELARQMSGWVDNLRASAGRTSMFDRGAFTPPDNVYAEKRSARHAVRTDDVVSAAAEITEAFAFQGQKFESVHEHTQDVFNQLAARLDMDSLFRRVWREEYTENEFYVAIRWGYETFQFRGKGSTGARRSRASYRLYCPTEIAVLDSANIAPLQVGPLNQEILLWMASQEELDAFRASESGTAVDVDMMRFFTGVFEPTEPQRKKLREMGVTHTERLLVLNPAFVKRHTTTKPDYQPHADVRLKTCFPVLDLKRQLMAADRAALVGAANYILLIRKGDKDRPAKQEEIDNLQESYSVLAKVPVIIADHRLSIEIIAPKTDFVLQHEKYELLNRMLLARLLGTLSVGGSGQRNETNVTISYAVARGMENRRHQMKRFFEKELCRAVMEHPNNKGVLPEGSEPNLVFTPRNISLGFDQALMQMVMALRTQLDVSRETILEYVGLDQETEALRRQIEAERFDDIFGTLTMPGQENPSADNDGTEGDGPNGANQNGADPSTQGARGGRPKGGGRSSRNPAKTSSRTASGNKSTGGSGA